MRKLKNKGTISRDPVDLKGKLAEAFPCLRINKALVNLSASSLNFIVSLLKDKGPANLSLYLILGVKL